jgi:hypothetical protein
LKFTFFGDITGASSFVITSLVGYFALGYKTLGALFAFLKFIGFLGSAGAAVGVVKFTCSFIEVGGRIVGFNFLSIIIFLNGFLYFPVGLDYSILLIESLLTNLF